MVLSIDDVVNKTFTPTRFQDGYNADEVDNFLDEIIVTLRSLLDDNARLRSAAALQTVPEFDDEPKPAPSAPTPVVQAPILAAPAPVGPVKANTPAGAPDAVAGLLRLAQRVHDEYVFSGHTEGDRLIAEAKAESARILAEAEAESRRVLGNLEGEKDAAEERINALYALERDCRGRLIRYLDAVRGEIEKRGEPLPVREG